MLYDRRIILASFASLAACGFTPIYGDRTAATASTGRVEILPISGKMGFELRKRLSLRLGAPDEATHRLKVTPTISTRALAISSENSITRYSLTGNASYALTDMASQTTNASGRVRGFASYSATASTYATSTAAQYANMRLAHTLAEQIAIRLAATAEDWVR